MSDNEPIESLLKLADEQIEEGRRWAAHASLMGAYGQSRGDKETVTRICDLLAELESVQCAASFVLRDLGIQWDLLRAHDVDDPDNLFDGQLYDDTADLISSDWETGRDKNESLISKAWEISRSAADQLGRLHQRFQNEIVTWARKVAHPQRNSLNRRTVGLLLSRLGDPACVECFLPTDGDLSILGLPAEHAWGCGFVEELRERLAALELYCENSPAPVNDTRIL